jgi:hypothetical protein
VGAAGHAVMTNFRKRADIGEQSGENAEQAEQEEENGPGNSSSL